MNLGMIGLGKMGSNMTRRLLNGNHSVVVYDPNPDAVKICVDAGAIASSSVADMTRKLTAPRVVWMMVPAGDPVEMTVEDLMISLDPGDILIDGGNSYFKDTCKRADESALKGIHYLDAGTSGGVWGLQNGYCLMVGGPKEAFDYVEPILKTLAPPDGYAYVGASGAGHYSKMVHNGIEYGMLQAYGEGFEILHASDYNYDLQQLAHLWNQGSVIRSWLLELAEEAFEKEKDLASIEGYIADSGEGRWTVEEAIELNVPAPVLTLSLLERFASRQKESFSAKVIAALRNEFGGHAVKKRE